MTVPRLVATDLDGTLVRSDDTVSAYTHAVLDRVRAAGIRIVAATGRGPRLASLTRNDIRVADYLVLAQGGWVLDQGDASYLRQARLSGAVLGPRFGRRTLQAGTAVGGVGWLLVVLALRGSGSVGFVELLPGLLVAGLGIGLVVAPMFDIILASVADHETGSALLRREHRVQHFCVHRPVCALWVIEYVDQRHGV